MTFTKDLISAGMYVTEANAIGGPVANNLTATGSTQGTALLLSTPIANVTTVAASTGVVLPAGLVSSDDMIVRNGGANALAIYPPVGGTINGAAANTALSVASGKVAHLFCLGNGGLDWIAVVSA